MSKDTKFIPEKNIDARVQKNRNSILELERLLRLVISEPEKYLEDDLLISCLKSQGALAKYHNEGRGIYASSLNTIKRISEASFDNGFFKIDQLRIAAANAIHSHPKNTEKDPISSKAALKEKIKDLEILLNLVRKDCWHLSRSLKKALDIGRFYAERTGDVAIIENCAKEQRDILRVFQLCKQINLNTEPSNHA